MINRDYYAAKKIRGKVMRGIAIADRKLGLTLPRVDA
jgi:hypothetical protein